LTRDETESLSRFVKKREPETERLRAILIGQWHERAGRPITSEEMRELRQDIAAVTLLLFDEGKTADQVVEHFAGMSRPCFVGD
jgi:hypothetical protein